MIPTKQTQFSDKSTRTRGNCFAACLASLIELPITDIPAFQDMPTDQWGTEFIKWLYSIGWEYMGDPHFNDLTEQDWKEYPFIIVGGESPRDETVGHAVIYYKGLPFFDPHPSEDFILEEYEAYLIRKQTQQP